MNTLLSSRLSEYIFDAVILISPGFDDGKGNRVRYSERGCRLLSVAAVVMAPLAVTVVTTDTVTADPAASISGCKSRDRD
jgi:hypothetical protein